MLHSNCSFLLLRPFSLDVNIDLTFGINLLDDVRLESRPFIQINQFDVSGSAGVNEWSSILKLPGGFGFSVAEAKALVSISSALTSPPLILNLFDTICLSIPSNPIEDSLAKNYCTYTEEIITHKVKIQLPLKEYLHLAEVEVWGRGSTGGSTGRYMNVALNKQANMSSVYDLNYHPDPQAGVDGVIEGSLFHTGRAENPWWEVDLTHFRNGTSTGLGYLVTKVVIHNRNYYCEYWCQRRLSNANVSLIDASGNVALHQTLGNMAGVSNVTLRFPEEKKFNYSQPYNSTGEITFNASLDVLLPTFITYGGIGFGARVEYS
jgi:hypothetical protein